MGALAVLVDERLHRGRAQVEAHRVDIHEQWAGAHASDGAAGSEERVRAGDDFVLRPDVEGHQRQQQRVRTGTNANAVCRLAILGAGFFQRGDVRAEDEHLRIADALDGCHDFRLQRRKLRLQVQQGDSHLFQLEFLRSVVRLPARGHRGQWRSK